jgi:hypothetical protein
MLSLFERRGRTGLELHLLSDDEPNGVILKEPSGHQQKTGWADP